METDMDITQATAFVTGANRGVGKVFVASLLERGVRKVYAAARDPGSLNGLLEDDRVVPVALDVTDAEQIQHAAAIATDVTLLINNAGALSFGGALEVEQEAIARDMAVNYTGLHSMTRAFSAVIEANGGGTVVNMLSLLSFLAAPGFSAYNASKAAAWSMSMSLRPYLSQRNIKVLNAFPGGIDTEMLAGVDGPKDRPEIVVADVLNAVTEDLEDVYPGAAQDAFDAWRADPKAMEKAFATMM